MLYFDNAATTYPKPGSVLKAVDESIKYYCANPGRAGHNMAQRTSKLVFSTREKIAELFGFGICYRIIAHAFWRDIVFFIYLINRI